MKDVMIYFIEDARHNEYEVSAEIFYNYIVNNATKVKEEPMGTKQYMFRNADGEIVGFCRERTEEDN